MRVEGGGWEKKEWAVLNEKLMIRNFLPMKQKGLSQIELKVKSNQ